MQTILFSVGVFGIALAAMAIGVLFGSNKPIKGSCGGAATGDPDASCSVCGGNPQKCEGQEANDAGEATDPHYSKLHKAMHNPMT